jgi:hypothetical protein
MNYGIQQSLTKENLLNKIDSYNIFKKYCPEFEEIGKAFKSPLRKTDKNPSSFIIMWDGDLLFKDFGEGSYRCISFVMRKYNLSFIAAMQKINADFDLGLKSDVLIIPDRVFIREAIPEEYLEEKSTSIIAVKRRNWEPHDSEYWFGRYMISRETLEAFSVTPLSHFEINSKLFFAYRHSYCYDYYWEDGIFRRKIYQPFSKGKWYSNGGAIVQGEGALPRSGDLLIITSSLKDVMTLYELGYTSIAPTSESTFVPESYFQKQESRFKRIVLFMDSDEAGIAANIKFSGKWGLEYISIPASFPAKDISDFVWRYGQEEANRLLTNLIR